MTIISGLALGIDAEAHRAAIDAGRRTIAVLPCSLETIYPPEHRQLVADILRNGAVISPFPFDTPPERKNFGPRNRLMSGLSRGVLVVEAGDKSGALLTAGYALEQGREVFAVPGNITAHGSDGTNRLIQDGAHPVLSSDDVLDVLNIERVTDYVAAQKSLPDVSAEEATILEHLSADALHVDDLSHLADMPVAQINSALTMLELKGLVRQVGPMMYVKR